MAELRDDEDDNAEECKVIELDFQDLYYRYANEQSEEMRKITASCIHEPFQLARPMEDIKKLQMALLELLDEDSKEIMLALIPNIKTLILKYINDHSMSQLPDRSPKGGDNTPTKNNYGPGLQHASTLSSKMIGNDFSALHRKYELNS